VPLGLMIKIYTFHPQKIFMCFYVSQSKQCIFSHSTFNGLDIITEKEGVYCALLRGMNQIFKYNLG
jgi:hypothetical protein